MSRPQKWLTRGGFTREDSDDELGHDDHPWQWIYEGEGEEEADDSGSNGNNGSTTDGRHNRRRERPHSRNSIASSRKRKASAMLVSSSAPVEDLNGIKSTRSERKNSTIVGAQMGDFRVDVGDAVFLKSPEQGKDWAGLICAFSETDEDGEEEMCAHIMWFCSPEELGIVDGGIGTKRGGTKRVLPTAITNETYITGDFNMNPLTTINGKATVMGVSSFQKQYPGLQPPAGGTKGRAALQKFMKTIMCRRAVKQRGLVFSDEFEWEDIYHGAEDLLSLVDFVKENTKKRTKLDADKEFDAKVARTLDAGSDQEETYAPETPRKKRKITAVSTPRSSAKSARFITPTHKRIMIKKPLEITPLGTRILSPAYYMASPYGQARTTLHVSAVPNSLPCRVHEFTTVYNHLHSAIADGSGACIYISGTPGTGKTATVREVVASLQVAVQNDELDDFNFVEINGMKVTEPHQSYSLLWEALKGDRVSPSNALHLLEHEFSHPSPRRIPCVVLMDELDQLVTKNQSVMYNFFNWPALRHSRLIVLAVANTMDLPERMLSNKISSRLGLTRITFPGYTHTQLMEIISSRLEGVPGNIVDPDAVQFASRKVAAVSGDARRALDICRRAVEIAEQQAQEQSQEAGGDIDEDSDEIAAQTPSKTGRGKKTSKQQRQQKSNVEDADTTPRVVKQQQQKPAPRVTIATIKQAINEATSSPVAQHLRSLPLASKLLLAALLARSRRTGVSESTFGDILVECKRIADVAENQAIHDFLLMQYGSGGAKSRGNQLPRVLAVGAAAMDLVEAGIVAMDIRSRGERAGKIRLRIGDEEVKSALMGDVEVRGMGFDS